MPRPFRETQTDRFCDLLADGCTVREAAQRMGIRDDYAKSMLQRVRRRLGPQAV